MDRNKYCIIMAGGVGSRFWPVSRSARPKQFLDIMGTGRSFIRHTFDRFTPIVPVENFLVVTNAVYKEQVLEHIPELKPEQILCEPIGRNTAPCIAYAAFRLKALDPEARMIITPADHFIFDEEQFRADICRCTDFVRDNDVLMTIGIRPSRPDTGYGYIQVERLAEISKVKTFTEKPNIDLARVFVESGDFFWNAGIFIWKVGSILRALGEHLPELYQMFAVEERYFNTPREAEAIERIYPVCRSISIDFGVMEKASDVYVHCSDFGWSDIGTWGSLFQNSERDDNDNVPPSGNFLAYDSHGCVVKAPKDKMVVIDGLEDFIVVDTEDALMVCPKAEEQNVKRFIEEMKFKKLDRFI